MRIDIATLFPRMFKDVFDSSIIGRAKESGVVDIRIHDIRSYTHDKHHVVDDYPYGGGAGMVLKPEPIFECVGAIKEDIGQETTVILLSPQGRLYNQDVARRLSGCQSIILICGHYEGVDERVAKYLADDEISIGDYVLSGGEIAAMVVADSIVRLLPGAVGSEDSVIEESHTDGLLEYPQYTRPSEYQGYAVPEVLLSGNHVEIAQWRYQQSVSRTAERRPELMKKTRSPQSTRKL